MPAIFAYKTTLLIISSRMGDNHPETSLNSSHAYIRLGRHQAVSLRRCTLGNFIKSWKSDTQWQAVEGGGNAGKLFHPSWISWWRAIYMSLWATLCVLTEWRKKKNECIHFYAARKNKQRKNTLILSRTQPWQKEQDLLGGENEGVMHLFLWLAYNQCI